MDHAFDNVAEPNGAGMATEPAEVRRKLEGFLTDGDIAPTEDTPPTDARQTDAVDPEPGLHAIERHPEDRPDALKIGVGEDSLLDPDAMRVNATDVGITEQAVEPDVLFPLLEAEYEGLLGIRRGAVEGPALEEAGRLAATGASTDREVAAFTAEGLAAADEAARYETDVLLRLNEEAEEATAAHDAAVNDRDVADAQAIADPAYWEVVPEFNTTPRGGPLHWLAITPGRAKLAAVAEVVVGGLVLSGPVGEAISLDFPFGSVLVAMALSLMLFLLGWFGGKALAAVELPARIVAGLFVLAAVWIVWRTTNSIDALRTGNTKEGKTVLTAATLANVYVAALTAYAASLHDQFARRRELIAAVPTPTDLWLTARQRREDKVVETKRRKDEADAALNACYDHIEERKTTAAGTDGRCRQREADGITAGVGYETLKAITGVHMAQEVANRDAAVTAAKLAHTKLRAEAYPEPGAASTARSAGSEAEQFGDLNTFHKAAIVCLLIGAIGGLLGSQLVLTLGAAAAAVLLLLGLSNATRRRTGRAPEPLMPGRLTPPVSTSPGIERAPGWKVPPRSTKAKYEAATHDPTQQL